MDHSPWLCQRSPEGGQLMAAPRPQPTLQRGWLDLGSEGQAPVDVYGAMGTQKPNVWGLF